MTLHGTTSEQPQTHDPMSCSACGSVEFKSSMTVYYSRDVYVTMVDRGIDDTTVADFQDGDDEYSDASEPEDWQCMDCDRWVRGPDDSDLINQLREQWRHH